MNSSSYVYRLDAPVDHAPERVVSLVPGVTEAFFDLNLGDRLVGRSAQCIRPVGQVERLPTLGDLEAPAIEQIIALQPGLVLFDPALSLQEALRQVHEAGIPVWGVSPRSLQENFNLLWNIMNLFDQTEMVARVRLIEQVYDRLLNLAESSEHLPSVVVVLADQPLRTVGHNTYLSDLLYVCGARNVFAEREPKAAEPGALVTIQLDEIESAQPDLLLLPDQGVGADTVSALQVLKIPATQQDRVITVSHDLLTWYGTRVAYALDQLPAQLRMDD